MGEDPATSGALTGRTALVTGAGHRVGAEIARALFGAGSRVAIHYGRSESRARELVRDLDPRGDAALAVQADLSSPDDIEHLFGRLTEQAFLPDILVNSAAIFEPSPSDRLDLPGWQRTLDINLTAPYVLSMHAAGHMSESGGDIVNIADVWGFKPLGSYVAYSTSKAGVIMLTKALARAFAPRIRVNAVAPGPVMLPEEIGDDERARALGRTLLRREGSPVDVANAVLFLVMMTDYATGSVITIDGGRSIV